MAFAFAHRVAAAVRESAAVQAGRRVTRRLHTRRTLTPQQRAHRYISRMPVAVVTASLGGHPRPVAQRCW